MRKSILNPFNLNKRFVIIVVIMFALFAAIGFIAGCGDDNNPTGGNGNPPVNNDSLIFSVDSFTVYSSHAPRVTNYEFTDTTNENRKYRVVCEVTSNVPASNDTAYFSYICLPYPNGNIVWLESRNDETQSINLDYTFTQDSSAHYSRIRHLLNAGFYNSYPVNVNHYISVKKFHLYLVH